MRRPALALICSALLAVALAMAFSTVPEQRTVDEDGQEYAAHWVVVQFISSGDVEADHEAWTRAAQLVSGSLAQAEAGQSLRRVMFLVPKDYDGLRLVCDDLRMMECVYDALPDPYIETPDGTMMFKYFHDRKLEEANAVAQQSPQGG